MPENPARRRLLLLDQIALVLTALALCAAALIGHPPIALLDALGGLLAGFGAPQNITRNSIVANLVPREDMPAELAFNFGLFQLTMVFGPGLSGLLIAAAGVSRAPMRSSWPRWPARASRSHRAGSPA